MYTSNKLLGSLIIFTILNCVVLQLTLPKTLPLLLELIDNNQYDVLHYDVPLFLSSYIESGEIEKGRSLSKVGLLPNVPNVPSYSGYFTVNQEFNSNIFFWFFPALNKDLHAPIILWLQGGPGTSGLVGLFVEHGPYIMYSNRTAGLREHTWTKEFSIIYVDNPVGTGFSFTDDDKGYATSQEQITNDLYSFLRQFFQVYYEFANNDFYIFGESYGGKHGPYLGFKIHTDGPPAKVNFKGIAVGNPFFDVPFLLDLGDYYLKLGLIDYDEAFLFKASYKSGIQDLKEGNYLEAYDEFLKCTGYFGTSNSSYLSNFTSYNFFYNLLITDKPEDYSYYISYVQLRQSRNAIHVGSLPFHTSDKVFQSLKIDLMASSSKYQLASLMDNYKVLVYNGQLDLIVPYFLTENLLRSLNWKNSYKYKVTKRKAWRLGNGTLAGYVKNAGNMFGVLVRNAGHSAPRDQPEAALDLITKFIKDITY